MSESDDGEPLSQARRLNPKRHNAKRCPFRPQIVNALANGDSKRAIARALHVSNNTVDVVEKEEWQQVEARKGRIAAQCERNATLSADRITRKLESSDDIPLNLLVPVHGVSVDKLLALSGEPALTVRHEHLHVTLSNEDMLAAALERKAQRLRLRASTDASASGENGAQKEG